MMIRVNRFNLYLVLTLAVLCGCQTEQGKKKRQVTTLEIHLEADRDKPDLNEVVSISRSHPVPLSIQKTPFLTEAFLDKAELVDVMGGFEIRIHFARQGAWLLEEYSTANHGKHLAIFSKFVVPPSDKLNAGRWLAAPKITQRIADGTLTFTPDADRLEADQIVLGLKNIARQMEKDSKSW